MFLSFTVFEDLACTKVRTVANLYGQQAARALQGFKIEKGSEPKEGDILLACRIDRIGSEDISEAF